MQLSLPPTYEERRDLLKVNNGWGARGGHPLAIEPSGGGVSRWNCSFVIPIGLLLAMSATNIGLNVATFVMVHNETKQTEQGPSMLFGVDTMKSTMVHQTNGLCKVTIPLYDNNQFQFYQFVDRPYRGDSKQLTADEFASFWERGTSFASDPPNTAVKMGSRINFNTVEIINVTKTTDPTVAETLHLVFRQPTANGWGGLNADKFCISKTGISTPLTLFVDSGPVLSTEFIV